MCSFSKVRFQRTYYIDLMSISFTYERFERYISMRAKTEKKKRDFIAILSSMTDTELNNFIKMNGKPPKPVVMCRIVDKEHHEKP